MSDRESLIDELKHVRRMMPVGESLYELLRMMAECTEALEAEVRRLNALLDDWERVTAPGWTPPPNNHA